MAIYFREERAVTEQPQRRLFERITNIQYLEQQNQIKD